MNRRLALLLAATLFPAASALAQRGKLAPTPGPPPLFYEFKNVDRMTAISVTQLAAQLFNVDINFNNGLRAAVIRPLPSAVADWQQKTLEFLKRYDVPPPAEPQVRYVAYLIRASKVKLETEASQGNPIPKPLDDAIAEMKSSLAYLSYDLLTTVTSVSQGAASSGDRLPGHGAGFELLNSSMAYWYNIEYANVAVAADRKSVSIRPFKFALHNVGNTETSFSSNVTVHGGQRLVLGKLRLSDAADIFVVLTAKVE